MHRLTTVRTLLLVLVAAFALPAWSCAGQQVEEPELEEPAEVERLRLKITKVRNAIEETRSTIAQSRGAPHLPEMYLRLAELLSEEARYHYQLAAERQQSSGGLSNVPQVRLLKGHAIDIYRMMLNRFEESELIPRVLFNLGHEQRELGNFAEMRGALNELIENHTDSPLRNNALLVMGDFYFDRSKLGRAEEYYRQITEAPLNAVSGLGHYKLAWVEINLGDCASAIESFESAIEKSKRWEERGGDDGGAALEGATARETNATRDDIDVRREALVDVTYCYSRERDVDDSVAYLRERAHSRAAYVEALAKLAQRYRLNDTYEGAILVTRELMRLAPSNRDRIEDARTFYTALKNEEDYSHIGEDVERIAEAYTEFYSQAPVRPPERRRLREEFEPYVRDLATRAQEQFQKSGDVELGEEVARAYGAYVDTFPRAAKLPEMLLNMADVLAELDRNLEAGKRALRAADLLERSPKQKVALYDAVVYFQNSLDQPANRRQFERVSARGSLRRAARRLLDYSLQEKRERRVKFAIAQSYYDEGRYLQAADQLSAVAYEFPNSEEADAAIQLVLDSYDTLNDYDGLRFASRRFLRDDSPASSDLRAELQKILSDAQQRKIDELSLRAAGDEGADLGPLMEFAEEHEGRKMGERALINAFVAARAKGNTKKMYQLADEIAATYSESDQLPGIYTTVAEMARARFEFRKAVQFMQRAASVNPDQQVELLTAAGEIYEQMGLPVKAESQYREAIEAADGAQVGRPAGRLASLLERNVSASEIARKLSPYADTGDPEVLSRLGLAHVALGNTDRAERAFQRVLEGGAQPSVGASARAQYGMAETVFTAIEEFPAPDSTERVQKFITLVEVGQQKYVSAARQGSPIYTAAALSRLSRMLDRAGDRLEEMELPADLSSAARANVQEALESRIQATRKGAKDAMETCREQLWSTRNFSPVVRKCYQGETLDATMAPFDTVRKGDISKVPGGIESLRQRVSKNPDDVETLRKVGNAFMEAGNPHAARVVFAQAVDSGGGPKDQNLLGVARFRINDRTAAFEAFANAAEGGIEAGRQNLVTLVEKTGLSEVRNEILERFSEGEEGGRRLSTAPSESSSVRLVDTSTRWRGFEP